MAAVFAKLGIPLNLCKQLITILQAESLHVQNTTKVLKKKLHTISLK